MDREYDQEVVLREHGDHTSSELQDSSQLTATARAAGVRQPPMLEVTTPNGRVWYLVNLN